MKLRLPGPDELHTWHWHKPCEGYGCATCGFTGMEYDKKPSVSDVEKEDTDGNEPE